MEYYVGHISRLFGKDTDFAILPEARCWDGSEGLWSHLIAHRFSSTIFTSPHFSARKEANTAGI
eukprot:12618074-Alexandrium_andersonii.AAC.1